MIVRIVDYDNNDFIKLCTLLEQEHVDVIKEQRSPKGNCLKNLDKFTTVFVAYDFDKPIGCLGLKDMVNDTVEVGRLFVSPLYRKKGVATLLFNNAFIYARTLKAKKMILDTYKRFDAAINLYKKLGFYEIDNYIENSPYSVCMEKNLDYKIRLATKDDVSELSKLKHDVWETTYRGIYSDSKIDNYDYKKNEDKFLGYINNPDVNIYVACDNDKIIGYMECGMPKRPFEDYEQEIGLLYILKEYQGQGVGKELFNLAYNEIKNKGYKEFFISCNKYNKNAQEFYKRMGGEVVHIDEDNIDKSIPQVHFLYKIK